MSKIVKVVLAGVVAVVVLVTAGTYGYIHFIRDDAPAPLRIENANPSTPESPGSSDATTATNWQPTAQSQVGYRVDEVLFGQNTTAVGRTNKVTGSLVVDGTTVKTVDLVVDMGSVASDQARRDNQFKTRIMTIDQFPTATFELTQPITLPTTANSLGSSPVTVKATGDLTLRGKTKSVTTDLQVSRNGKNVQVNGSIPVLFADYGIPNPSFAGITTEDHGDLELLVVFEPVS